MLARITPHQLAGSVPAIASKSLAHRFIIAAALSNGITHITCNSTCDDIEATIDCLTALGAQIKHTSTGFEVHPIPKSMEHGILRALAGATLNCRESGSTLRFMLPVTCALAADPVFTGAQKLGERPLTPLLSQLSEHGCEISKNEGFPLQTSGRLQGGRFDLPGDVSSQFISGLLLAAPLLGSPADAAVHGKLESKPYVTLTLEALQTFGIQVDIKHAVDQDGTPLTIFTVSNQTYRTPGTAEVEGDWSNAAFWLCAGALGKHAVTVRGLNAQSAQGDRAITAALTLFGAYARKDARSASIKPHQLHGITLDATDIPDLVPILCAVAASAQGTTRINGCARLRSKESDRIETTVSELQKLGAHICVDGDSIVIHGQSQLQGGRVESHNDHRIAMMAAVASIRCSELVEIKHAEAVNKSYPDFFEHFRQLGGQVELLDE